jgi:transketolase
MKKRPPSPPMLSDTELADLARTIRFRIIRTSYLSGTPHLGSCLSCVDLLVYLYWNELRINPLEPKAEDRDRFILSKGHAAPALFQVLAERGFFPVSDLENYGADGGIFGEHPPTPEHLGGIEAATGSLGHGMPMGLGMALASRIKNQYFNVFAILGDGECNEGTIWEAAMLASAQKVENLKIAIDYNKWQATGRSNEILDLSPLSDKWRAFGWEVREIDGHDFSQIRKAYFEPVTDGRPLAIIANTIKGKGVSFMQDDNNWHYRIPNQKELMLAANELSIPHIEINIDGLEVWTHA